MSDVVIEVDRLSKQYWIGETQDKHKTLRDSLARSFMAPIRAIRSRLSEKKTKSHSKAKELWALEDVSFQIKRGEVVGLIGRNGAGKSTLLKILSRITEPTQGHANIHGRVGSLLEVGTGFHPELTGRENIYLNGAILGMKRKEIGKKFDSIVAFAEIERFIDTPVKHYSSGMYLRLAFAVAAHLEPEILLVDEVLAVGDAAFQKKCLGKMSEVAKSGHTVLLVSHNMAAVTHLCRQSICLDQGKLVAQGETEAVLGSYLSNLRSDIPKDGFATLRDSPRHPVLMNRHAQFDWVRTLNAKGSQTGIFLEMDPIRVELGFTLTRKVTSLQLACGVTAMDIYADLIMEPSPDYHGSFEPGTYRVQCNMDPMHLRQGHYCIAIKMFANGIRQDSLSDTAEIFVQSRLREDDLPAYSHRWASGKFRFGYAWDEFECLEAEKEDAKVGAYRY